MAKKPGKSSTKTDTRSRSIVTNWREKLVNTDLDTDEYIFDVAMVVEMGAIASPSVDNIIDSAQYSDNVKTISKSDILKFLNSANEKTDKDRLSLDILKAASSELDPSFPTSQDLAALIKMKILDYKEEFIENREICAEIRKQIEEELKKIANPPKEKGKGKDKNGKKGKKDKGSKKDKGKAGKGAPTLEELYLMLHKDVNPEDLPPKEDNLYRSALIEPDPEETKTFFVLCNFYDLDIIEQLMMWGVQVILFIEIGTEYREEVIENENIGEETPKSTLGELDQFWDKWINSDFISDVLPPYTTYFKFTPHDGFSPAENFDDLKRILKNIDDMKRQYKNYFNNVRHIDVKEYKKPINVNCLVTYNSILNQIPNECVTIPFMLDSLLEEICVRINKKPSTAIPDKPKILHQKTHGGPLENIKNILKEYDCTFQEIPVTVNIPKTIHLRYGNVVEYTNAYIKPKKSVVDITIQNLKRLPPANAFEMFERKSFSDTAMYKYLFRKWSQQEDDVTVRELKQCVYSILFTRKNFIAYEDVCNRTPPKKKIQSLMFSETKTYNEHYSQDDPNININPFESKLSKHKKPQTLKAEECCCMTLVAKNCVCARPIEFCNLSENLDDTSIIQMLITSFEEYRHFDYKYFAPDDVVLIRFHHKTDIHNIRTQNCINSVCSVLCFRDFCLYVLPSETDWFFREEEEFWIEKRIKDEENRQRKLDEINKQIECEQEFIVPGSVKDQMQQEELKENKAKGGKKGEKAPKGKKEKEKKEKKGKESGKSTPLTIKLSITKPIKISEPRIPKTFPQYVPGQYVPFEIYNLGPDLLQSFEETTEFHSIDGVSVSVRKQQWSNKSLNYSFNVSANSSSLIIHNQLQEFLTCEQPFQFHVNVPNGTVMVFSKPFREENQDTKHVVTTSVSKKINIDTIFSKLSMERSIVEADGVRIKILKLLKEAIQNQIPVFKIVSSRLHKFQYVKRIKSLIEFPVGNVIRRILCKPKLFIRKKRSQPLQEKKVIPFTDFIHKKFTEMNMEWRANLPNGLQIQTVPAVEPYLFYIRQKYIIYRSDLKKIKDESYRCFLRNGTVMKFLKDGTILTYSADKSIVHYKYGCFSSNINSKRKQTYEEILQNLPKKKEQTIRPLHYYSKNLSRLQKNIRRLCNRYKDHLIDISDNYKFESSRMECRKLHKVYKLSKKLFNSNSYTIPLLNYTITTGQGRKIDVKNNIVYDNEKQYLQSQYTDLLVNETVIHREDGTSWLLNKNGSAVTQFPDGTRITTWYTELNDSWFDRSTSYSLGTNNTPEMDKHTQFDDFDRSSSDIFITQDDELSALYTIDASLEEGFVLIGMNYMMEHPNYATVVYYCSDDLTEIHMPDKIQVNVSSQGSYIVNLHNDDFIDISKTSINFHASSCKSCNVKTTCSFNIASLINGAPTKDETYFIVRDSENKVFQVNYNGDMFNYEDDKNDSCFNSICSVHLSDLGERYFVLRRDLSGEELHSTVVPYRFLHTLNENEVVNDETILLNDAYCTTIIQPLQKTYSEHLMMLYDFPILATTSEKKCIDKLWKLHNFDMDTVIFKRNPVFTFNRYINRLPMGLVNTMIKMLDRALAGGVYNVPDLSIVDKLSEVEELQSPPPVIKVKPQPLIPKKSKTVDALCKKYRQLIKDAEIPNYFETLYGKMFLTVEECSEGAMDEAKLFSRVPLTTPELESYGEEIQIEEEEKIPSQLLEYPGRLDVPEDITIHLKPDSKVHEIELKSTGIRVITEDSSTEYPFIKQSLSKSEVRKSSSAKTSQSIGKQSLGTKLSTKLSTKSKVSSVATTGRNSGRGPQVSEASRKTDAKEKSVSSRKSRKSSEQQKLADDREFEQLRLKTNADKLYDECKKRHSDQQVTCTDETCVCSNVYDSKATCYCGNPLCVCLNSVSSFGTMKSISLIDYTSLASSIIKAFEPNVWKLKLLRQDLDAIIETSLKKLEKEQVDLGKLLCSLRKEFPFIGPADNMPSRNDILEVINALQNDLQDSGSVGGLGSVELEVTANLLNGVIIAHSKCGCTASEVDLILRHRIKEINIPDTEMNKVLDIVTKKVTTGDFEEQLSKIPEEFRDIIIEIDNTIESRIDIRPCCDICGEEKEKMEDDEKVTVYICQNPKCPMKTPRPSDKKRVSSLISSELSSALNATPTLKGVEEVIVKQVVRRESKRPSVYDPDATLEILKSIQRLSL